ncbi:MAG: hypothetical protein HUK20_10450 [Fibrobacter sp.]|nr:hypothetical protein [Fibrobacter sp.]
MESATTSMDTIGEYLSVNINIAKLAPGVFPDNGGLSVSINYSNYSSFEKSTHYSYPNSGYFVSTNNIPVYVNGIKISGEAPIIESANKELKLRFVGIQPEANSSTSPWIEVENYGSETIGLSDVFLKWSSADSVTIGENNDSLPSGKRLRICRSSSLECPASDKNTVSGSLKFGKFGEFELIKQTQKVDYVAWGKKGSLGSSFGYLKTERASGYGMQVGYSAGCFFRYSEDVGWNLYRPNEISKSAEALPDPVPFGIEDGMALFSDENGDIKLSWIPVKGAKSYEVAVYNHKDELVYKNTTEKSFVSVKLQTGKYRWNVASVNSSGVQMFSNEGGQTFFAASSEEMAPYWSEGWLLNVEPIGARKDTKMLVTTWGNLAEEKGWNRIHTLDEEITEEETWRCWAVGINMLDRFFNGTLTQDEIKMFGSRNFQNPNMSHHFDFLLSNMGGGDDEMEDAVFQYAFNEIPQKFTGTPSFEVVKNAIDNGSPLYVSKINSSGNFHVMIIDGYGVVAENLSIDADEIFSKGDVLYHFLNIDNNGSSYWIKPSSYEFKDYRIVEKPAFVRNSDYRVSKDSDGDGIVDYDEEVRFRGLSKEHIDSDKDGVRDLDEFLLTVRTYPACGIEDVETEDDLDKLQNCLDVIYNAFDIDGDGFPNYFDSDADGGGEKDGSEVAEGRNPLNPADDRPKPIDDVDIVFDLPGDITIYSLDEMRVNDRTVCHDGDGFCKIASESSRENFSVNIGVQSVVGDIHSHGTVWLRTLSEVIGNINLYVPSGSSHTANIQGTQVKYDGKTTRYNFEDWPYKNVWDPFRIYFIDQYEKSLVVTAGQEATLRDGDNYALVKVESGAVLNIEPGIMKINTIQFESGSTINFTNPGQKTEISTDNRLIWRANIANEDQELVAKGFKLKQFGDKDSFIEGDWAGTIHAAKSDLIMGQTKKLMYGRFLGKAVTIHQNSIIYRVDFAPIDSITTIAMK